MVTEHWGLESIRQLSHDDKSNCCNVSQTRSQVTPTFWVDIGWLYFSTSLRGSLMAFFW